MQHIPLSWEIAVWNYLISKQAVAWWLVCAPDSKDSLTELHSVISIRKGSALSDKPFNGVEIDGEPTAFTEISVSQASQG